MDWLPPQNWGVQSWGHFQRLGYKQEHSLGEALLILHLYKWKLTSSNWSLDQLSPRFIGFCNNLKSVILIVQGKKIISMVMQTKGYSYTRLISLSDRRRPGECYQGSNIIIILVSLCPALNQKQLAGSCSYIWNHCRRGWSHLHI